VLAWSQAVTTGVFTLLGAAIGIALGGVVDAVLESRRESLLVRQSKRMVAEELNLVCMHLSHFVDARKYPTSMGSETAPLFPNLIWLEHRATLAKGLDDDEYKVLSRVSASVTYFRDEISEGASNTPAPSGLVDSAVNLQALASFAYKHLTGEDWDAFKRTGVTPADAKGL
jgi:hypothetical protein